MLSVILVVCHSSRGDRAQQGSPLPSRPSLRRRSHRPSLRPCPMHFLIRTVGPCLVASSFALFAVSVCPPAALGPRSVLKSSTSPHLALAAPNLVCTLTGRPGPKSSPGQMEASWTQIRVLARMGPRIPCCPEHRARVSLVKRTVPVPKSSLLLNRQIAHQLES